MKILPLSFSSFSAALSLFLAFIIPPSFSFAQSSADKAARIKSLIDSGNYVFHAQTALPMSGRTRHLTTDYTLTITKGKIKSDLPYYGRAYTAPMDPTQGGIQLNSAVFDYTLKPKKKGGWDVSIKPRDGKDVQQLSLSISTAGYATLQVISVNRQAISFNGIIRAH